MISSDFISLLRGGQKVSRAADNTGLSAGSVSALVAFGLSAEPDRTKKKSSDEGSGTRD